MEYKRTILKHVIDTTKSFPITLITGARQVGKTTLVKHLEKDLGYNYITFDKTELKNEARKNPYEFIR